MRASLSLPRAAPLLLTVLTLILPLSHEQDIGERCSTDSFSGVCKIVNECSTVYEALKEGQMPAKTCGYRHFIPIVCCPTNPTKKPAQPAPESTTEREIDTTVTPKDRALARAKCAEAAKAVYGLEIPHILSADRQLVNVSRCADILKSRQLIVGGKKAEPREFPHMAALGYDPKDDGNIQWLCGGTLISAKVVLTAAHCTWSNSWRAVKWARVGDLNLADTTDDAKPQTVKIRESIRHEKYKRPSQYHDIAILRLEREVTYNAWVRPACLPVNWPDVRNYNQTIATGWGLVDWADDAGSDSLLKVSLNLVSHDTCNGFFSDGGSEAELAQGVVDEWQMCAGQSGKDTCQGDSGGPIVIYNDDHECMYTIVGITSVGRWCGSDMPGIYTRVYHYVPWIERNAWPEDS
ncbi:venom protease-like [Pseudomyrmex gracilis]|uniref:venom protease-like n=1 Tax=Pseudomyrmex gracilis TaxID=219809 RepID=UPI000995D9A6|nr:venom protease-like [Pseudomyrmex gracilis]